MEPWASLMARGHKRVETRSWSTRYVGLVAIQASRSKECVKPEYVADLCTRAGLPAIFAPDHAWPLGKLVAVGELVACARTEEAVVTPQERALGDYSAKRFAFAFRDVWRLPEPIPCRGALSLWEVPPEVEREIAAQKARLAVAAAPVNGNGHAVPEPPPPEPQAILLDAIEWAKECGLRGSIHADGPTRVDFPQRGHGYWVQLRERTGQQQMGTARFTADGRRAMWTLDGKGGQG
jgi:hypothetical protein